MWRRFFNGSWRAGIFETQMSAPVDSFSKDLEGDILGLIKKTLQEMAEGEVKTVSV